MIKKIRNFFKVARLISTIDAGAFRQANIQTLGKIQRVMLFTPYGLMHNPPADSMALVWSQQGHEGNGIAMADDPNNRTLTDLTPGEVALGNYVTGAYLLFDDDGNLNIELPANCNITAANITLTASSGISLVSPSVVNNSVNIGSTHVHSQGSDSDGDTEVDTEVPH